MADLLEGVRPATWSAKFEHTLHFMLRFTEDFSTKDQLGDLAGVSRVMFKI